MICCLCGEPFRPTDEPVIIDEIHISRNIYGSKDRSATVITGLPCHRQCWRKIEANIAAAESETCEELEAARKERRGEG
jgi:phenylacetate-coenzyme A ligase PaaK-like adenylate-forming protein